MKFAISSLCALILACGAVAAERPQDYAYGSVLDADGRDALYEITLPATVYQGLSRSDLGDLRVFNGAGEIVPHAWRPRATSASDTPAPVALTLFPLRAEAGTRVDGLSIQLRRGADGATSVDVKSPEGQTKSEKRTVAYLIDLRGIERTLRTMEFEWNTPDDGYAGRIRVDASEDLANWRTLVAAAPLVSLAIGGQTLRQKRVELPQHTATYLRLSWVARDSAHSQPDLISARGELAPKSIEAPREWASFEAARGDKAGEYLFDLRGWYPIDRVRLSLPEANTIAPFELLVRDGADLPWRSATRGVAYRLRHESGEITSPDIAVGMMVGRHWLLRIDQRGGGIGSGMPGLHAGWVPHQLVFAARGAPPFQLAYGNHAAQPVAYPIETVIPGYRSDATTRLRTANAGAQQVINVRGAQTAAQRELGGEARRQEAIDWKRWSLWGALVLGVVVLAAMAWRLARQIRKDAGDG